MPEEAITTDVYAIDDNVLKVLGLPQFLQSLLASSRVRIKNKSVTNNKGWQIAYSFVWIALVTYSCAVFHQFYYKAFFEPDFIMYLSCFVGTATQNASIILSILSNRFSQRENNRNIYVMLQSVDRILGLEKVTYYSDFQNRCNVLISIIMFVGFMAGYFVHAFVLLDRPLHTAFFAFGLFAVYMDYLLGPSMIYFLAVRTKILNVMIKDLIQEYKGIPKQPKAVTLKKFLYSLVVPTIQKSNTLLPRDKWLELLLHILKTYKMIKSIFEFSIFNLAFTVLLWTYLVISADIIGKRSGLYPLPAQITLAMWAGVYYIQLFTFAVMNDWFILEVKRMKLLCIRLISYDYEGPYQKTASEMINIIHNDTPIFTVYGIFVVDKRLPLEIIGIIATNTLVLIQLLI